MAGSPKGLGLTPELHAYLLAHGSAPDAVARDLIAETEALGGVSKMQIAPEQGAFMALLARIASARRAVEVGTFTGYSALCVARALPEGGRLLALDVSEEWTAIARRHWERAGVAGRIDLRIGPALDTLKALPAEERFDFAFIDGDKREYPDYYEAILARMDPGGLILVDNVLWGGEVVEAATARTSTQAIRAFNDLVARDPRVEAVMLPISDGLTIARKR